jgi:hypothetical protein
MFLIFPEVIKGSKFSFNIKQALNAKILDDVSPKILKKSLVVNLFYDVNDVKEIAWLAQDGRRGKTFNNFVKSLKKHKHNPIDHPNVLNINIKDIFLNKDDIENQLLEYANKTISLQRFCNHEWDFPFRTPHRIQTPSIVHVCYSSGCGGNFLAQLLNIMKGNTKTSATLTKHGDAHRFISQSKIGIKSYRRTTRVNWDQKYVDSQYIDWSQWPEMTNPLINSDHVQNPQWIIDHFKSKVDNIKVIYVLMPDTYEENIFLTGLRFTKMIVDEFDDFGKIHFTEAWTSHYKSMIKKNIKTSFTKKVPEHPSKITKEQFDEFIYKEYLPHVWEVSKNIPNRQAWPQDQIQKKLKNNKNVMFLPFETVFKNPVELVNSIAKFTGLPDRKEAYEFAKLYVKSQPTLDNFRKTLKD